jgi:hypothetical protein
MNEGIFAPSCRGLRSPGMPSELGERSRSRGAGRAKKEPDCPLAKPFSGRSNWPKGVRMELLGDCE